MSTIAGEGIIQCSGGAWKAVGSSQLPPAYLEMFEALFTPQTPNAPCVTGQQRIALDASGNLLACVGGVWTLAGGGGGGQSPAPFGFAAATGQPFGAAACSAPASPPSLYLRFYGCPAYLDRTLTA